MSLDAASYPVLWQISDATGIRPEYLLPVLQLESGLNPAAQNSLGYSGLNQINAGFLSSIGVDPATYLTWPASAQLQRVVGPYLQSQVNQYGPLRSATRTYQANFLPATLATAKSLSDVVASPNGPNAAAYAANVGLDANHDGAITVGDLAAEMTKMLPAIQGPLATAYTLRPNESSKDPVYGDDFGMSLGKTLLISAAIVGIAGAIAYYMIEEESSIKPLGRLLAMENPRDSMQVQSLIFDRDQYTVGQAKAWARGHGFTAKKVDVTDRSIRLRQLPPGRFNIHRTKNFGHGIKAVVAR